MSQSVRASSVPSLSLQLSGHTHTLSYRCALCCLRHLLFSTAPALMYAQSPFASERTELFVRLYSVQKFTALNPALGK